MADEQKDEQEPKTRTRSTASAKAEQTEQEQSAAEQRKAEAEARAAEKAQKDDEAKTKREAERKEREEKREQEKKEREAKREEEKAKKEQEREEAKAAKEREKAEKRQAQIDSGEIIFASYDHELVDAASANGDFDGITYTKAEIKKETVAQRARDVILDLMEKATEVPLSGKELATTYEGGTVQWVSFFGMLRVLGYVQPYRFKTGSRGEAGLAYKWIGPTDLELVNGIVEEVESAEPVEA